MSTLFQSVYTLPLFADARGRERGKKKRDPQYFFLLWKKKKEISNLNGSELRKQ